MPNSELVHSLIKGLDLLSLISSRTDGIRLNELVELTGMKKPTLHNLLRTLCAREFLCRDSMNRFHVGPAVLEIADNHRSASRRTRAAEIFLELSRKFPDDVLTLARLMGPDIRCIFRASPDRPGELQRPADRKLMPYVSASSVVLQAANPLEAAQMEEHYPFEEYGIGMWGTQSRLAEAKAAALKQQYFLRDNCRIISMAFIMPGAFALGFSFPAGKKYSLDRYIEAAAEFRRRVWGND